MISTETLYHKNPQTGAKQPIGLGYLDDSMQLTGQQSSELACVRTSSLIWLWSIAQHIAFNELCAWLLVLVRPNRRGQPLHSRYRRVASEYGGPDSRFPGEHVPAGAEGKVFGWVLVAAHGWQRSEAQPNRKLE
jgi:hypothetical protein